MELQRLADDLRDEEPVAGAVKQALREWLCVSWFWHGETRLYTRRLSNSSCACYTNETFPGQIKKKDFSSKDVPFFLNSAL